MDIRQTVVMWGNATAVRVPAKMAKSLGMIPKSEVSLSIERGALVIRPVVSKFTLEGLLNGMTPATLDDESNAWLSMGDAGAEKDS